jgi:NTE family protein
MQSVVPGGESQFRSLPHKLRHTWPAIVFGLIAAAHSASAADIATDSSRPAARPRIGLVLGGGGAKGAAHIGVIKVLEEMRIPVDCIAGTSMGSLVGAAYATGLTATELENVVTAIHWKEVLASAPREDVPVHRKNLDFAFTNGLEFGVKDNALVAKPGIVPSHKMEALFRRIVAGAATTSDFNKLPIPFRAVATDLENGKMVVFDHGELAVAMRASMAVPGAFAPVEYQGRLLVDGMLVRNLPVDVARQTCADVVIAVRVGNPPATRDQLTSFLGIGGQAMNVAIDANENAQLATLKEKDVAIKVTLQDIGASDFARVPDAIPIGEAAARAAAATLSRYSVSPAEYAKWRAGLVKGSETASVRIDEVRVAGLHVTNPQVVKSFLQIRPGDIFTPEKADADADRLVARGDFTTVSYRIDVEDGRNVLIFDAVEKPWGPNYLMFDLNLSTDFKGVTGWGMRVDYEKRWLNSLGGELRTSLQLGRPNFLTAEFYQPVDTQQRFFVAPSVYGKQVPEYLFLDSQAVGLYDIVRYGSELDVGTALGSTGELRLGVMREHVDTSNKVGVSPFSDDGHHTRNGYTGRFIYDSVDNRIFPTRGTRAVLSGVFPKAELGSDQSYDIVSLDASTNVTAHQTTWQFALRGGSDLGSTVPFYDQFKAGGLFNFSGFRYGELMGGEYALGVLQFRHPAAFLNETLGTALYSGGSLEVGNMFKRFDGIQKQGAIVSGSFFFAVDSKAGPFYLALGLSEGGRSMIYFYLGTPLDTVRR